VARLSRRETGRFCRRRTVNARPQCGVFLSRRRVEKTLRKPPPIEADACAGIARETYWMALHCFGYHRKSRVGEQFYSGGLSDVSAAISVGVAEHALLAQIHQMTQRTLRLFAPQFARGLTATGRFLLSGGTPARPAGWVHPPARTSCEQGALVDLPKWTVKSSHAPPSRRRSTSPGG
jgi:hypothetical protein